ncbi:MAG: nucleotide exchange factor GrpE [Candidatus Margulisbacteria bacterium]|nr:nucleotide exchange factor GrpE [Candidatus Margulisiibacteriota bacterium]
MYHEHHHKEYKQQNHKDNEDVEKELKDIEPEQETDVEDVIEEIIEGKQLPADQKIEPEIIPEKVDINELAGQIKHKKEHHHKGEELSKKDTEINFLKDQLLRHKADFDNYRKRMENDKREFSKYALEKSLLDFLPIVDSFDRALHPENQEKIDAQKIYQGFELINKQLTDFLNKQGVTEIVTKDQKFDPYYHQAVSQEKKEGVEKGQIIKEYQKGYLFHKKVLRPSMVVVAE